MIQPAVVRADYCLGIEDVAGLMFVHATVLRWTAQVMRAFRADLDGVLRAFGPPLFACAVQPHGGEHRKFLRFVERMGFGYHSVIWVQGLARCVFVRWT